MQKKRARSPVCLYRSGGSESLSDLPEITQLEVVELSCLAAVSMF